jgi:hypothetical protein
VEAATTTPRHTYTEKGRMRRVEPGRGRAAGVVEVASRHARPWSCRHRRGHAAPGRGCATGVVEARRGVVEARVDLPPPRLALPPHLATR